MFLHIVHVVLCGLSLTLTGPAVTSDRFAGMAEILAEPQRLPPPESLQAVADPPPPHDPDRPSIGLAFAAVSEGAYIGALRPGGPADSVGLEVGMIITKVNETALAGLSTQEIAMVLDAAKGPLLLEILDHGPVTLSKE